MGVRERFALYLDSTGPGGAAARAVQLHGAVAVAAARAEFTGKLTAGTTTTAQIEAMLGAPDARSATTLEYALAISPGYRYAFTVDDAGRLMRHGFRRVGPAPPAPPPPARREDNLRLLRQLAAIGATMEEVRAWLGEPEAELGWWPVDDWVYPAGLVIEFRHGIVVAGPTHAI